MAASETSNKMLGEAGKAELGDLVTDHDSLLAASSMNSSAVLAAVTPLSNEFDGHYPITYYENYNSSSQYDQRTQIYKELKNAYTQQLKALTNSNNPAVFQQENIIPEMKTESPSPESCYAESCYTESKSQRKRATCTLKSEPSGEEFAKYREKRRKNNESAKKSRDLRRQKEEKINMRVDFLEHENRKIRSFNKSLEYKITVLTQQRNKM